MGGGPQAASVSPLVEPSSAPLPPGTALSVLLASWVQGLVVMNRAPHPHCFLAVAGPRGGGGRGAGLSMGFRGPRATGQRPGRSAGGGAWQVLPGVCPMWPGGPRSASRGPRCRGSAWTVALPQSWRPGPCGQRDTQTNGWTHRRLVAAEAAENGRKPGGRVAGSPWVLEILASCFPNKGPLSPQEGHRPARARLFRLFHKQAVFLFCSWHNHSALHAPRLAGHHRLEIPRASGGQEVSAACPGVPESQRVRVGRAVLSRCPWGVAGPVTLRPDPAAPRAEPGRSHTEASPGSGRGARMAGGSPGCSIRQTLWCPL